MNSTVYRNVILTVIAFLLAVIALRPVVAPPRALAQTDDTQYYIEPRTYMLRKPDGTAQLEGKVIIDRRTGHVYGFPTLASVPYPVDRSTSKPPVSEPMYLGRFDFTKMNPPR